MDEECRNEVPKHPRNAWIFFYQEQCKLKDDDTLKAMLFYLEHYTPAEYFTTRCGMRPSPRLLAWGDKDIRERACWFNKTRKRKGEKLKFSSAEGRIGLVLDLIMFEGKNVKEKIMEKAKKKYPSPKGKN
ncbi:hypothetical protein RHMOL_Rhmol01G0197100 [Rhododendron molle]|uniref:Uncharacterized protein n=1 Tax=Rhododendron molle TaxID=49168 RepID=A0ACC0Q6Q4_RHOML|nr:hypothetical protein RHMOL_Rhmol01G0197100 [Rhododendron molle]